MIKLPGMAACRLWFAVTFWASTVNGTLIVPKAPPRVRDICRELRATIGVVYSLRELLDAPASASSH